MGGRESDPPFMERSPVAFLMDADHSWPRMMWYLRISSSSGMARSSSSVSVMPIHPISFMKSLKAASDGAKMVHGPL